MVYRNDKGQESNNGHVTVLLKLADGTARLVDASDPVPFVNHKGILLRAPAYRYVSPIYRPRDTAITSFLTADTRARLSVAKVTALDASFIRSQFWFYRGERIPGGVIATQRTPAGLAASRKALEESVRACPGNSLSVYMLGRAVLYQGDVAGGRRLLLAAQKLYAQYGWVPPGLKDAVAAAQARPAR